MTAKLNRDEILRGILQTLVDGWGINSVQAALANLAAPNAQGKRDRKRSSPEISSRGAAAHVQELDIPPEKMAPLLELAKRFDEGSAFPKMGDIRSFLLSHQQNAAELKGRVAAFKRMLPIMAEMSPKGLGRLISRSHHSGPADLAAISDAIRGAGEDLRGRPAEVIEPDANEVTGQEASPPDHDQP